MALPKEPDRLRPHCEFPPSKERWPEDDWPLWADDGVPPDYDPPTVDPLRTPAAAPLSVWAVGIRLLLLLAVIIAGICFWPK